MVNALSSRELQEWITRIDASDRPSAERAPIHTDPNGREHIERGRIYVRGLELNDVATDYDRIAERRSLPKSGPFLTRPLRRLSLLLSRRTSGDCVSIRT